jgi:hypothetical protein
MIAPMTIGDWDSDADDRRTDHLEKLSKFGNRVRLSIFKIVYDSFDIVNSFLRTVMASPVRSTIATGNNASWGTLPIELDVSHKSLNNLKTQVILPPPSVKTPNENMYIPDL